MSPQDSEESNNAQVDNGVMRPTDTDSSDRLTQLMERYTSLHNSITSFEHPNPRFLVFHPEGGLANKELGLISSALIALLTNRALLGKGNLLFTS